MMDAHFEYLLSGGAIILGLMFGVFVQRSRFCMTAAIANIVLMRDYRQLYGYIGALVVALIGTQLLEGFGVVDVAQSAFRSGALDWVGVLLGGLIFGIGSVFAGGCVGRILVRTGEGCISALLALMTLALGAVVAYLGILEPVREWLAASTSITIGDGDGSMAVVLGLPQWLLAVCLSVLLLGSLVFGVLRHLVSMFYIVGGALIGLVVVGGWCLTGYVVQDEFTVFKPYSLSFSGPVARTAVYLFENKTNGTFYSIALVFSVLTGAFISSIFSGTFKLSQPDSSSIGRTLVGGFMMGVGAIFAGGCNIGQGLSGMSTLAIESVFALFTIVSGMYIGIKWLQHAEEAGTYWFTFRWSPGFQHIVSRYVQLRRMRLERKYPSVG